MGKIAYLLSKSVSSRKIQFSLVFGLKFIEEYKGQGNFAMAENLSMSLYNFVIRNKVTGLTYSRFFTWIFTACFLRDAENFD